MAAFTVALLSRGCIDEPKPGPTRAYGTPDCAPGPCACAADRTCSCAPSPVGTIDGCAGTCDAGCDLQCDGTRDCDFDCGDDCLVMCFGSGRCDVSFENTGRLRCVGRGDCYLDCGGPCVLDCEGNGNCGLQCIPMDGPSTPAQDCGGGRQSCGPCPP